MIVKVCGGVKEHSRSSFLVLGNEVSFLVDAGLSDDEKDPYPRISEKEVQGLTYIFITHSHKDHSGALKHIITMGFMGVIVASRETLRILKLEYANTKAVEEFYDNRISLSFGRSGHSLGSIWYYFILEGKALFFTGDYREDNLSFITDRVRNLSADIAVLDAGYANKDISKNREKLTSFFEENPLVVLPLSDFGKEFELLELVKGLPVYGDATAIERSITLPSYNYYLQNTPTKVLPYSEEITRGVIFLIDPNLKKTENRALISSLLDRKAKVLITGASVEGSYTQYLLNNNLACLINYPVHQTLKEAKELKAKNDFKAAIFFHSPSIDSPREFII